MRIKSAIFVLLVFCLSCHVGDDSETKKEALKTIVLDYFMALANKDIQKATSLTTDNFVYCEDGVFFSSQSAINEVKKMKSFAVSFAIDSLNVHMDKKDASAYYFKQARFQFADSSMQLKFFETATFNKVGQAWKLRVLHSSVIK